MRAVRLSSGMSTVPTDGPTPTLPTLDAEQYVLDADDTATGPLQALVLDHLLVNDGTAYWIDAAGHARTDALKRLAPSSRVLRRIQVARGFTAYQHAALLDRVTEVITPETPLVVTPAIDVLYRNDDGHGVEAPDLLRTAFGTLAARCRESETPLVVTFHDRDVVTAPVARHVDEVIRCETTQFGPRFVGEEFETLVYPLDDGTVQTTLAFWHHVLDRRATITAAEQREVMVRGSH